MNDDNDPIPSAESSGDAADASPSSGVSRRKFLKTAGAAAALGSLGALGVAGAAPSFIAPPGWTGGGPFSLPRPRNGSGLWSVDYAGNLWPGLRNGPALFAMFFPATGIYVEADGALKNADARNSVIRNVSNLGDVTVFSGSVQQYPFKDGAATEATYNSPNDIDKLSDGSYVVADRENNAIRRVAADGTVVTIAGKGNCKNRYNGDQAIATNGQLNRSLTLVVTHLNTAWHVQDTIYFADRDNFLIRKLVPNGDGTYALVTVAGVPPSAGADPCGPLTYHPGAQNGPAATATFRGPCGVALSADERFLYVAERDNNVVRVIDLQANVVGTYAGVVMVGQKKGAFQDGPALTARFNGPSQIDRDNAGNLYLADRFNHRIRQITPSSNPMIGGTVSTFAGDGTPGRRSGPALFARFYEPWGVAYDRARNLVFVGDTGNSRIAVIGDFAHIWSAYAERVNAARIAEYYALEQQYMNYYRGNMDIGSTFSRPLESEGGPCNNCAQP